MFQVVGIENKGAQEMENGNNGKVFELTVKQGETTLVAPEMETEKGTLLSLKS